MDCSGFDIGLSTQLTERTENTKYINIVVDRILKMAYNWTQLKEVRNYLHFAFRSHKYKLKVQLIIANV